MPEKDPRRNLGLLGSPQEARRKVERFIRENCKSGEKLRLGKEDFVDGICSSSKPPQAGSIDTGTANPGKDASGQPVKGSDGTQTQDPEKRAPLEIAFEGGGLRSKKGRRKEKIHPRALSFERFGEDKPKDPEEKKRLRKMRYEAIYATRNDEEWPGGPNGDDGGGGEGVGSDDESEHLSETTDVNDFPEKDLCEPKWIDQNIGFGMMATRDIDAGEVVFTDEVMYTTPEDEEIWKKEGRTSDKTIEKMLEKKVKEMGPAFVQNYLNLPNSRSDLGKYAGIFHTYHLPIGWMGQTTKMCGCRVGMLNHSCLANSNLIIKPESYSIANGIPKANGIRYVAVQALCPIPKDAEITISYYYPSGTSVARIHDCAMRFGFTCRCRVCRGQNPVAEKFLRRVFTLDKLFNRPGMVEYNPGRLWAVACQILVGYSVAEVPNGNVLLILMRCAILAAFHSDRSRAMSFATRGHAMAKILEGPRGYYHNLFKAWLECIEKMPGWGATKRGICDPDEHVMTDNEEIAHLDVLFMINAKRCEYVRVDQYELRLNSIGADSMAVVRSMDDLQVIKAQRQAFKEYKGSVGKGKRKGSGPCIDKEYGFAELYLKTAIDALKVPLKQADKPDEAEPAIQPFKPMEKQKARPSSDSFKNHPHPDRVNIASRQMTAFKLHLYESGDKFLDDIGLSAAARKCIQTHAQKARDCARAHCLDCGKCMSDHVEGTGHAA